MYKLTLYVAGQTERSVRAQKYLETLCAQHLACAYEVQVIDVLENPEAALAAQILVTPTIVRELPLPQRRLVGDLSDAERVIRALGLDDFLDEAPSPKPPNSDP
ncbi:MAG: circadian clock protein KaiB [Chloroflexi bacterium CFX4]|nr:circadian clock protein KaiB [Chloroflexi bacterium CFX4]MDL1922734.1 circadian clock protein KaiB [Chloroflexi bacterium CFX3]